MPIWKYHPASAVTNHNSKVLTLWHYSSMFVIKQEDCVTNTSEQMTTMCLGKWQECDKHATFYYRGRYKVSDVTTSHDSHYCCDKKKLSCSKVCSVSGMSLALDEFQAPRLRPKGHRYKVLCLLNSGKLIKVKVNATVTYEWPLTCI